MITRQMHTLSNILLARSRFRNSLGKLELPLGVCEYFDRFELHDPIFVGNKGYDEHRFTVKLYPKRGLHLIAELQGSRH